MRLDTEEGQIWGSFQAERSAPIKIQTIQNYAYKN